MAFHIADLIEHAVDLMPDRTALETDGRSMTYAELEREANALAHELIALGVRPTDSVGLYSRNTLECVVAMLAIFKVRAVMVNVNYRYVAAELEHIVTDSDMKVLIYERQYGDRVRNVLPNAPELAHVIVIEDGSDEPAPAGSIPYTDAIARGSVDRDFEPRSDDDLYMLYTGGTTGFPKGVVWRQEDIWRVLGGGISSTPVSGSPTSGSRLVTVRQVANWCAFRSRHSSTADRSGLCSRSSSSGARR